MTPQEQIIDQINTKTDHIKAQMCAIMGGVYAVPATYGGIGDLGHVEEVLGELVDFLSVGKGGK
jgi:hypothetical protein